jgi:hypothetical protein
MKTLIFHFAAYLLILHLAESNQRVVTVVAARARALVLEMASGLPYVIGGSDIRTDILQRDPDSYV